MQPVPEETMPSETVVVQELECAAKLKQELLYKMRAALWTHKRNVTPNPPLAFRSLKRYHDFKVRLEPIRKFNFKAMAELLEVVLHNQESLAPVYEALRIARQRISRDISNDASRGAWAGHEGAVHQSGRPKHRRPSYWRTASGVVLKRSWRYHSHQRQMPVGQKRRKWNALTAPYRGGYNKKSGI